MPKAEEIKILNVDGVPRAVDQLPEQVKRLVETYNEWNQKQTDLEDQLQMVRSAKNDLSRQIISTLREHENREDEASPQEADSST